MFHVKRVLRNFIFLLMANFLYFSFIYSVLDFSRPV